jgi:D-alanine transaminase
MPVTKIDGQPVGNGHPGILTMKLRQAYIDEVVHGGRGAAPGDVYRSMAV